MTGSYTITPTCALRMEYRDAAGKDWVWTGALIDNGKGADVIVNEPGTAINGTLKKQ